MASFRTWAWEVQRQVAASDFSVLVKHRDVWIYGLGHGGHRNAPGAIGVLSWNIRSNQQISCDNRLGGIEQKQAGVPSPVFWAVAIASVLVTSLVTTHDPSSRAVRTYGAGWAGWVPVQ